MKEDSVVNQRVIKFINSLFDSNRVKNQVRLSEEIGVSSRYISNIMTGFRKPGKEFIFKIIEKYPDAHEYIFGPKSEPAPKEKPHARELPEIKETEGGRQIPFIDTDIYASFIPSMSDTPTMHPSAFVRIPLFRDGDVAMQVTGHSMKPYINHNDWVVLKKVTSVSSIFYGEPYVVVTKADNYKTLKFLKESKRNPKFLTLTPYNVEQFEAQDILKEDILEVWKVVGLFRSV